MRGATKSRSVPACASCKKSKARCEILDDITQKTLQHVRCHRCKALQIQCSYEYLDKSVFRTGPACKTQAFEQVVRLDMDLSDHQVTASQNHNVVPEEVTIPALPTPAPVREISSVVVRSKSGQDVVDLESLPRHIWQFYRGSAGQWHYDGIFHYEDSLDWAHPLSAIQQLSDRYNASVVTTPRIMASATSKSASGIDKLDEILSQEQRKHLLDMCVAMFHPPFLFFDYPFSALKKSMCPGLISL